MRTWIIVVVGILILTHGLATAQSPSGSPVALLEAQVEELRLENASLKLQLEQTKGLLEAAQAALASALGDDPEKVDAAMKVAKESGSSIRMIQVKVTGVKERELDEKALARLDELREAEEDLKKQLGAEEKLYRTMETTNTKARSNRTAFGGKKAPLPQPHSDATMKDQNSKVKRLEAELRTCTSEIKDLSGTSGKKSLVITGTGIERPESVYEIRVSGGLVVKAELIHLGDRIAFGGVPVDTSIELQIFNARKIELLEK